MLHLPNSSARKEGNKQNYQKTNVKTNEWKQAISPEAPEKSNHLASY